MTERRPIQDPRGGRRVHVSAALLLATIALEAAALTLIARSPSERVDEIASIRLGEAILFCVTWLTFAVVGVVVVRRQPDNPVGWLCIAGGLQVGVVALATGYATFKLTADPGSAHGVAAAWISHVGSATLIFVPVLIALRFPSGRPLSKAIELVSMASIIAFVLVVAVEPMPLMAFPTTFNPLAIGTGPRSVALPPPVILLLPAALVAGSIRLRYLRGSAVERLQMRWLGLASLLVVAVWVTTPLTSPQLLTTGRFSTAYAVLSAAAFTSMPVAIGIAVVRYHLYDIDLMVKRTLVYGVVSAVLFGVYLAAVLVLQGPLGTVVPGEAETLATAASTLLVAGLFRPVRDRAQRAIDRRFDRERYEARRTIEAFAGDVRDEVELHAIVGNLLRAARQTVRPVTVGCWLRPRIG
jgi:hypothetical protein